MKKIKALQKAIFIIAMAALTSVGCAETSDLESHSARTKTDRTAQPSQEIRSAWAQETAEPQEKSTDSNADDIKWHYNKKTKYLTISGTGEMSYDNTPFKVHRHTKEIVIDEGITVINDEAFRLFDELEKITLPDSLQKIGRRAFWKCYSLKEIIIPRNVNTIGEQCFYRCKSLRKITLGKNVEEIGRGAFGDCPAIRKVQLSPKNRYFMTKNGGLYQKNEKILYLHYAKSEEVIIEKGTKRIAEFAFQWNEKVRQITIPDSVETIGGGAMRFCSNLKMIKFSRQSRLKAIESYYLICPDLDIDVDPDSIDLYRCFDGCKSLREFISPESLERVDRDTFQLDWTHLSFQSDDYYDKSFSLEKIYLGKNFKGYPEPDDTEEDTDSWEYNFTDKTSSLKEYVVSKDNEMFCSKNGVLYDKKMKTLLVYPPQKSDVKFTIPKGVKAVMRISDNDKLRKLVVPDKNTKFHPWALSKKNKRLTIYGKKNSAAYRAAKEKKIKFVEL